MIEEKYFYCHGLYLRSESHNHRLSSALPTLGLLVKRYVQSFFLRDASMNNLSDKLFRVHVILQEYVSIHDQIFKPSLRKAIRIPGLFKPIDFGKHFEDLGVLVNALEEVTISTDLGDQQSVFIEYVTALLCAIEELRVLCEKLFAKSEGTTYSMEEYKSDVAAYQDLVSEYRAIGSELNIQLKNLGIPSGGLARPAKSRMLINHFIHIIAGLLISDTFIWSTSGMLAAVLLSAVTQVIDQFRIYRHYQNEFQYLDLIQGNKGRSLSFEIDSLLRHGQMFILKVIWYGLVTMVAAGFRR